MSIQSMSDELDRKLNGILNGNPYFEDLKDARTAIKLVFIDDGWFKDPMEYRNIYFDEKGIIHPYSPNVMTGQEWYDKFEKELDKIYKNDEIDYHNAIKAAKKAIDIP